MTILRAALLVSATAFAVCPLGCGGGDGASKVPTVTARPKPADDPKTAPADKNPANGETKKNGGSSESGAGSITGVVKLTGDPPTLPPLVRKGDKNAKDAPVCAAMDVPNESLVVSENGGGVANVFVYLSKAPEQAGHPASDEAVEFDQEFCRFKPHCLIVRTGTQLKILNSDQILHNTRIRTLRNGNFDAGLSPGEKEGVPHKYGSPEPEPVRVGCDIHPWMAAYHLPLNHGCYALTDKDGKFTIPNVPKGRYQVNVWHERAGFLERNASIVVRGGQPTQRDFDYQADRFTAFEGPAPKTVRLSSAR